MKKIDWTKLGGMPLDQDDFEFWQTAIYEGLTEFIKAFRNPSEPILIVSGCVATDAGSGDVAISAGWLLFGDEFVQWAGATVPDTAGTFSIPEFDTDTEVVAAGTEVYEDGTSNDTYLKIKAIIVGSVGSYTQAQYMAYFNELPRIQNYFTNKVIEKWIAPTIHPSMVTPIVAFTGAFKYRKTGFNRVELTGNLTNPAGSGATVVCILPVGYRPDVQKHLLILAAGYVGLSDDDDAASLPLIKKLIVRTNGEVVIAAHPTENLNYVFDGMSFELNVL